ncbi:MAG: DNA repair protein RecN [Rhodospirillaceae bacterium]|nr:DNA repair protein RecN [Rhodospirillaceae bacterium]
MLVSLSVRDVVLIDRLALQFPSGLCALTGETGAGKSILLDALGLALGARADSGLVRHGADQAIVTAEFDLPAAHPAVAFLRRNDLAFDEGLMVPVVVRRSLTAEGRSRAFVNDQPTSIGLLRQLGEMLVEVHGQFDTQGLLNPQTHRAVLDAHCGAEQRSAETARAWRAWKQAEAARDDLAQSIDRARAEEAFMRHALAELDAVEAAPGEEAALAERRALMMNRERLVEAMTGALDGLSGDRGAERSIGQSLRMLDRIADRAGALLDPTVEALERAAVDVEEAVGALQGLIADMEHDTGELERIEERLFALRALARKHGVEVDRLAEVRDAFAHKLKMIDDQSEAIDRLAKAAAAARQAFVTAAEALSAARLAGACALDAAVGAELGPLKLGSATFATQVERLGEDGWGAHGIDRVTFLVSTNPGAPLGPINRIASGGELARFMLALKVVLAATASVPTLVFDEVDSGISGSVADAVGERLARLGGRLQVLVVTHSPQVAARAGHHWQVRKTVAGEGVATTVIALEGLQRREEIARMLSGATITEQARAAADSLIGTGNP